MARLGSPILSDENPRNPRNYSIFLADSAM
jgi:hypothetical protein